MRPHRSSPAIGRWGHRLSRPHRLAVTAAGLLVLPALMASPVAADPEPDTNLSEPVERMVRNVNSRVPASVTVPDDAVIFFTVEPDPDLEGGYIYSANLDPAGASRGSHPAGPAVATLRTLMETVATIGAQTPCQMVPTGPTAQATCEGPSEYVHCTAELSLVWSYDRSLDSPTSTVETNHSHGELVCPFDDVDGSVHGAMTSFIDDRGVSGLAVSRPILCPGSASLDGSICLPDPFRAPNHPGSATATQFVPVLTERIGVPLGVEVHGAGSSYQFQSQFAFTIPELFGEEVVYACAVGEVIDPLDTMEPTWLERPCDLPSAPPPPA
jgi:hypothetical protein